MRRTSILFLVMIVLSWTGAAYAAGQEDEPKDIPSPMKKAKAGGIDFGLFVSAGKAVRMFDFDRLNNRLAVASRSPFTGYIDDWNFEIGGVATGNGIFTLGGGFYKTETGGDRIDAELSGYEIMARWGGAVNKSKIVMLSPTFGIGYAAHTLSLDGDLGLLDLEHLPRHGGADLRQAGMMLEAGFRADLFGAWPDDTKFAFLSIESLTIGWQGIPIASDWTEGDKTVDGLPNDFTHSLFVRLSIGLGGAGRGLEEKK